jgi:hypothetical protein
MNAKFVPNHIGPSTIVLADAGVCFMGRASRGGDAYGFRGWQPHMLTG